MSSFIEQYGIYGTFCGAFFVCFLIGSLIYLFAQVLNIINTLGLTSMVVVIFVVGVIVSFLSVCLG